MKAKNKYLVIVALIVWVLFVGWGWMALSQYENTPGQAQASPPQQWPAVTKIPRTVGLPTMVMFLHPHCPCSRASMTQLSLIMAHTQNKVNTEVVFVKLPNFSQDWVKTDLYRSALRIPGVQVMIDDGGREAKIFHARVSGQVMLYDKFGKLIFNGGITSSRGHEGDNDGQDSIITFLTKGVIPKKQTPFFGCLLFNDETRKS
jgi:hypothetical protein